MVCNKCNDTGEVYTRGQVTETCECLDVLGIYVFPGGISYCDKSREVGGDYVRLAFLPFDTLTLEWRARLVPPAVRAYIERDAAKLAARRGQEYPISASGQTVILGGK